VPSRISTRATQGSPRLRHMKNGTTVAQLLGRRESIPYTTPNDLAHLLDWLRSCGVPNELSARTMGHHDTRMLDPVEERC